MSKNKWALTPHHWNVHLYCNGAFGVLYHRTCSQKITGHCCTTLGKSLTLLSHIPLSPRSIIWCWSKGSDAGEATTGLAGRNGSLLPGLWLVSTADWLPTIRDQLHLICLIYRYYIGQALYLSLPVMSHWWMCCKGLSLRRMAPVTRKRMKFRPKRSFRHSDVTATRKCTVVAMYIRAVACTYSNLTTRTRCGEARRSTTECITRDELVRCAYVMCFWLI